MRARNLLSTRSRAQCPFIKSHPPTWNTYKISVSFNSTINNELLLQAEPRRFNNLCLDLSTVSDDNFECKLDYSLSLWNEQGVRALWLYVPSCQSHLIPSLIQRGFDFHYASSGYVLMSKWMAQHGEANKLPDTPSSIIGVAGLVHNEKDELLLVQEKHTWVQRKWKFPGGLADAQEDIDAAIEREVFEETGIRATFKSVLGFRQQHGIRFGGACEKCLVSDFYIVCRLVVNERESAQVINKCDSEIYDAQWIPLKQFTFDMDSWEINKEFSRLLYDNLNAYKARQNVEQIENIDDVRLPCDMSRSELTSVAVPGSMYKLFYSQTL